ncbi:unnamed protein product [Caenorhabditis auriculariae]|uniref:Peptidase M20 dimerisation domain-containing protein n=1 Tax=Caenorhabditis auriculariae TaxID=2777116 RepID=A0A8S1H066_9PELO|nr:unnamed protein product [Caenorhabditis auriculariae]
MTAEWGKKLEERLLHYMSIDSTTGNEEAFGNAVCDDLSFHGFSVVRQPIGEGSTRFNVLATFKDAKPPDVKVLLNTHLDTVPPYFKATQDAENIYGRGSNDAKGQLACMVSAAIIISTMNKELASRLGLLFVVGEEVDHVGMEAANALDLHPTHLIVGEPTELKFGTIQKGALKIRLNVRGVAGHSGYLDSGKSAIHVLVKVLNDIMAYSWPQDERFGATTYNIGKICGGQALNAWAENASADLFFRITTSRDEVKATLAGILNGRAEMELLSGNDPVLLDTPPFEAPTAAVAFNTDLPYFNYRDKLQGRYLFGAGSIRNAHSMDEFMPKKELHECTSTLIRLIKALSDD